MDFANVKTLLCATEVCCMSYNNSELVENQNIKKGNS